MAKIVSFTQYLRFNFSSAEWRAGGRSSKYISRVELLTDIPSTHSSKVGPLQKSAPLLMNPVIVGKIENHQRDNNEP